MNFQNLLLIILLLISFISFVTILLILPFLIKRADMDSFIVKYLSQRDRKYRRDGDKIFKVPYGSIIFNEKLFINLDEIYKIEFGKEDKENGIEYSIIFNYKNGKMEKLYLKDLFIKTPTIMDEANKATHAFNLFKAIVKIKSIRDFYFDRGVMATDDEYDCIENSIYDVAVYKDWINYEALP